MPSDHVLFFDSEFDSLGNPIRSDVRAAALKKWPQLCALARSRLSNREQEIQELFETVIGKVSRYLERKRAPLHDPGPLLALAFRQRLNELASRMDPVVAVGGNADIDAVSEPVNWAEEIDRQILLEELVRSLSRQNRIILRLRDAGYEWPEIAKMFKRNISTLRNNFWREVRAVYSELMNSALDDVIKKNEE